VIPASTQLLVIGAGPAGMAAALAAAGSGEQVTVIDENPVIGGQVWRGGPMQWKERRAHALWAALQECPNVQFIGGVRVVASAGSNALLLEQHDRGHVLAWERLILCSGARELLLPFPGGTLPGVFGAGGLQALIKSGMPVAGKRVVVAGSGPLLLAVADTVRSQGGRVMAIVEHRRGAELATFLGRLAWSFPRKLLQAAQLKWRLASVPYLHGATVTAANGEQRLGSVTVQSAGSSGEVACDFLACGFGLLPNTELAAMLGCAIEQGRVMVDGNQRTSRMDVWAAGESTGIGGVDKALAEGRIAGLTATGQGVNPRELENRTRAAAFGTLLACSFSPPPALRSLCHPGTIVCRCEDVRSAQLAAHSDWRSAKLQTRVGMGPCQGRVCGAACEFLYGWQAPGLRQPIYPTSAAALAGAGRAKQEKDETR
jgi:NADPH-dependent 2,4-dienoyl-CoA reductase/sulfur reductase-like enzyme